MSTYLFLQLVAVHLVDSHYCSDPGKFISVLLTSLSTMVQLELPHINVLSKVDIMEQYGKLGMTEHHCVVFNNTVRCTVEPPNKGHFGDNISSAVLSLIERLSSSWRFSMNRNYREW